MAPENSLAMIDELYKVMMEADGDLMRQAVEKLYNMLIRMDVEARIGAGRYERTDTRSNRLNGSRERPLDTSVGRIDLSIPKLRSGTYMPPFLEPRRMVDKALVNVIQDAYINGVSTRKVDNLVESLGISCDKSKVSRFTAELSDIVEAFRTRPLSGREYPYVYLDATFPKVRESGQVTSMALMIAMAVNKNGDREILGFEIGLSEDGEMWKAFLESLVARGLSGVKLAISDAHLGLKKAIAEVFTGVQWQRCTVHFMRNVLCHVPQKQKSMVAAIVRTIFMAEDMEEARKQLRAVVDQLGAKFPRAMQVVEDAEDEVLTFYNFPARHRKSIYSTNVLERLNKEIRRRFNVVSVFPDRASVIRLGGAILMEQNDEWDCSERRYLSLDSLAELYGQPLLIEAA